MTAEAPLPTPSRALWRKHRAPLLAAVPLGIVLGVLADLALSLQTVSPSPEDRFPALIAYACTGAAFALVACIGAIAGALTGSPRAATGTPFFRIAAGAGLAILTGVLLVGGITTAVTDSWEWFPIIATIAVITGLIAGVAAAATTAAFQYRRRLLP